MKGIGRGWTNAREALLIAGERTMNAVLIPVDMLGARVRLQEERSHQAWRRVLTEAEDPPEKPSAADADSTYTPETLIELAAETWSFAQSTETWAKQLDERRQRRATGRIEWLQSRLTDLLAKEGIILQDLTGSVWDEGDAVEVVNPIEPGEGQRAHISAMLEPIVIYRGRLVRRGKVSISIEEGAAP